MALPKSKAILAVGFAAIAVALASHFNMLPSSIVKESEVPHEIQLATEAQTAPTLGFY